MFLPFYSWSHSPSVDAAITSISPCFLLSIWAFSLPTMVKKPPFGIWTLPFSVPICYWHWVAWSHCGVWNIKDHSSKGSSPWDMLRYSIAAWGWWWSGLLRSLFPAAMIPCMKGCITLSYTRTWPSVPCFSSTCSGTSSHHWVRECRSIKSPINRKAFHM